MSVFTVGQRWISHSEPQLGLGIVAEVDGRYLTISFPAVADQRRYAADTAPLVRVEYRVGDEITTMDEQSLKVVEHQENKGVIIYSCLDENQQKFVVPEIELNCFVTFTSPTQRLFSFQFDSLSAYQLRVSTLNLVDRLHRSDANGLLGSRTSLLPHQLYITHEVGKRYAPRVLLADEVGLGKTIEAGMIIHQQLHLDLVSRVLIVVPPSLIHQWMVEMLRRFNLYFSIFDQERLQSIEGNPDVYSEDEGESISLLMQNAEADANLVNPFESEQLILCSLDLLTENPAYLDYAESAEFDLLIVDEAHHLAWTTQSTSPQFDCIATLAKTCSGMLLLTATPESIGIESYFAQLSLLDPSRFHDLDMFKQEQDSYSKLNELVQQLLEVKYQFDQSGNNHKINNELLKQLKHYLPIIDTNSTPIESETVSSWIDQLIDRHGTSRVLFRNTRAAIGGFPARQLHLYPLDNSDIYQQLGPNELLYPEAYIDNVIWVEADPRVKWLEQFLKQNKSLKVLLICAHARSAIELERYLHLSKGIASSAFHENLSIIERDRAAAYFADEENGAQLLICSEIGSEGRNFQFAHHLVLFDLPLNPDLLEQRIGRLDRIGQSQMIQLHVPFLKNTSQEVLVEWYKNGLDQFVNTFSAGQRIFNAVELKLLDYISQWPENQKEYVAFIKTINQKVKIVRDEMAQGKDELLQLNSCRNEVAEDIINNITEFEQDRLINNYLEQLFDEFNVDYQEHSEHALIIEPTESLAADFLPGIKSTPMTITTDRKIALVREDMEFFSFEHPMIEQAMQIIMDGEIGNATVATLALKNVKPGAIFIETFYTTECLSPKYLQLFRYLSLSPLRIFMDEKTRDLGHLLTHEKLNLHCKSVDKKNAQIIIIHARSKVEQLLLHTEKQTEQYLCDLKNRAINAHDKKLTDEIYRLKSLQEHNPAIRQQEIDYFENQIHLGKEYLQRAVIKLQAIRVIVTV